MAASSATLALVAESIAAGRVMSGVRKHVSHIGKQAIEVPSGVTILHTPPRKGTGMRSPSLLTVTGPRGSTSLPVERFVKFDQTDPAKLGVSVVDPSKREQRERWGLTRSLVSNAITGMTVGFTKPVHLVGVGFRAALEPDPVGKYPGAVRIAMKLGYSHSVFVSVPEDIKVECPFPTRIMVSCDDKVRLGQFCADIRKWRKPEPYKGKVRQLHSDSNCLPIQFFAGCLCRQRSRKDKVSQEEIDGLGIGLYTSQHSSICIFCHFPAWLLAVQRKHVINLA